LVFEKTLFLPENVVNGMMEGSVKKRKELPAAGEIPFFFVFMQRASFFDPSKELKRELFSPDHPPPIFRR